MQDVKDDDRFEWMKYAHLFERLEIPARTFLLREGEVANHTYLLEKGRVRIWFNGNFGSGMEWGTAFRSS